MDFNFHMENIVDIFLLLVFVCDKKETSPSRREEKRNEILFQCFSYDDVLNAGDKVAGYNLKLTKKKKRKTFPFENETLFFIFRCFCVM